MILEITTALIILHGPAGNEIRINPDQVTSLQSRTEGGKNFTEAAHCLINLADGKYVAVVETCETVEKMLESY